MIFRTLSFCLGPGNIWRFPQVAFSCGNAIYIYLYIIYMWIFGVSLLVFEISLSQYFINGFAKMFTLYPIMEGITLSMAFYCLFANLLYSMIGVYSVIYSFSGMSEKAMSHSYCSESFKKYECEDNYTKYVNSPEYVYFYYYVERATDNFGDKYNWRNFIILVGVWSILCAVIILGILRKALIPIILSSAVCLVLLYLAIFSATLDSSSYGLQKMFVPEAHNMYKLKTWIYPIEQCVVTLGLGAGPLTTIWSISKIKYWSYLDCVIVIAITLLCSMLSGIIFFNAAAVVTVKNNSTFRDTFKGVFKETHVHILYSQLINSLTVEARNFTIFVYYFVLFCSCCYSLLEHLQIILLYLGSYITVSREARNKVIIGVCAALLFITNIGVSKVGYPIISSINKNFIATALLMIIFFELLSVSYLYGLRNFCDDIEFMLGFTPNFYFQFTWILLPGLFGIFSICSLYLKFKFMANSYDLGILVLMMLVIIGPVLGYAAYKCFVGIRQMGIMRVLNPRLDGSSGGAMQTVVPIDAGAKSDFKSFSTPSASFGDSVSKSESLHKMSVESVESVETEEQDLQIST